MKKRFIAFIAVFVLGVSLMPVSVPAADADPEEIAETEEVEETEETEQEEEETCEVSEEEIPDADAAEETAWDNTEEVFAVSIPAARAALPSDNRQTARWTYSSETFTEFYVAAYAEDTQEELSFGLSYSRTEQVTTYTVDVGDLVSCVTGLGDGQNDYVFTYATVYGIDYGIYQNDSSARDDESRWSTLGSKDRPVTSVIITKDNTQSTSWTLWQYAAYSDDELLGTIGVRAHDDASYPYISLQLWCSVGEIVAVDENTGAEYTNLQTAIGEASAGDTISLCTDLNVRVESEVQFLIDRDLTLNLNGHTITAGCDNGGYHLFAVAAGISATVKNGTIDGGDANAACYAVYGGGTASAPADVVLDGVTIQNFGTTSGYGTVYVYDGSLSASDCRFLNNGSSAVSVMSSAGSGTVYEGTALIMDGCEVSGNTNSTNLYGGGIGACQIAKVSVINCSIAGNRFLGSGLYGGGGVSLYNVGETELAGNEITQNTSASYGGGMFIFNGSYFTDGDQTVITDNVITGNEASLNGGGLTYYSNAAYHTSAAGCVFSGNCIDGNHTFYDGGGMSMYSMDPDFEFTIRSGTVCDNVADQWSGGIDFGFETLSTLRLYSALITENSAFQGGGVWMCSTADTAMYTTLGGAIYGNQAIDSAVTPSCGDDIRFRGDIDGDDFDGMMVNVSPRALGGVLMDWYTDESDARYRDGLGMPADVTEESYLNRTTAFSLHGELSAAGIALAKEAAATVISGNTANYGYGGGISSNARLVFGEDTTMSVTALKEWRDADGSLLPADGLPASSVEVTLVRVSGDGSRADLETVTLGEENGWMWTFGYLPTNYTYEVREDTQTEGYTPSYTVETDSEGNGIITITNEPGSPGLESPGSEEPEPDAPTPDEPEPGGNTPIRAAGTGDAHTPILWFLPAAAGALLILGGMRLRAVRRK